MTWRLEFYPFTWGLGKSGPWCDRICDEWEWAFEFGPFIVYWNKTADSPFKAEGRARGGK